MSDALTFDMGKFAAVLPADRRYCRNHMWCSPGPHPVAMAADATGVTEGKVDTQSRMYVPRSSSADSAGASPSATA